MIGNTLYLQEASECPIHKEYIQDVIIIAKSKTRKNTTFSSPIAYCKKCDAYLTSRGMEKDLKEVARLSLPASDISDIVNVEVLKE